MPNSDNPESPKRPSVSKRAAPADVPEILRLIRALAEYEKMSDEVVAIEADIRESMFASHAVGEALLARVDGRAVGVAVFFRNFFDLPRADPGLYLEDLLRRACLPRACIGRGVTESRRRDRGGARLPAAGLVGAGLEHPGDRLLPRRWCTLVRPMGVFSGWMAPRWMHLRRNRSDRPHDQKPDFRPQPCLRCSAAFAQPVRARRAMPIAACTHRSSWPISMSRK